MELVCQNGLPVQGSMDAKTSSMAVTDIRPSKKAAAVVNLHPT